MNKSGRIYVTLCRKGEKKKNFYVQVIVADHFLSNKPSGKATTLHIDGNITNNAVNNLKWSGSMATKVQYKPSVPTNDGNIIGADVNCIGYGKKLKDSDNSQPSS